MKKTRKNILLALVVAFVASFLLISFSNQLYAATDLTVMSGAQAAQGNSQPATLFGVDGVFTVVVDTLLYVIGH